MAATAAFRAEAARLGSDLFPVVTVYWPSWAGRLSYGPVDYLASVADAVAVSGALKSTSSVRSSIGARPVELQPQALDVVLVDRDQQISRIIKGKVDPRRSAVTLHVGSRRLNIADWFMRFDGILTDWDIAGTMVTLHCKTDDRVLLGRIPKPQITRGAFPAAPNEVQGLYLPVVLGIHDSQALSGAGMVPTVCIAQDATYGYRYAVTIGQARSVPRVYKNGNLQTLTTHYTVAYPIIGGIQLTTVDFVSATLATDTVTCDVEGLTTDGAAASPCILNPAEQMKWVLVNLVWNDWRTGAYFADATAPIDSAAWARAATYMQAFRDEGSMRLGGTRDTERAQDIFGKWLKSEPLVRGAWNLGGQLAVMPFSHLPESAYVSTPVLDAYLHAFDPIPYREADAGLVSKVSINHLPGPSGFNATLELEDFWGWSAEQVTETLDMPYSSARFQ